MPFHAWHLLKRSNRMKINYLATGIILRARARLRQNPAPPVANQNLTFCCKNEQAIRDRYAAPQDTSSSCIYGFDLLFIALITTRFVYIVQAKLYFDFEKKKQQQPDEINFTVYRVWQEAKWVVVAGFFFVTDVHICNTSGDRGLFEWHFSFSPTLTITSCRRKNKHTTTDSLFFSCHFKLFCFATTAMNNLS